MVGHSTVGYTRGRCVRPLKLLETESDARARVRPADSGTDRWIDHPGVHSLGKETPCAPSG